MAENEAVEIAIVGSGMAGLSGALYAGRYGMKAVVIGDFFGGATSTAWTIENYPGFKSIDGYDLMMKVRDQVESLGVPIITDRIVDLEKDERGYRLTTKEGRRLIAPTVMLAVGAARRKLGLEKEEEFAKGRGVHYCTTCDGPLYRGKVIGIVGGGDAAVKGANLAVQYAEKILMIVREEELIAEPINQERLKPYLGEKVQIIHQMEIKELLGQDRLTGVKLSNDQELVLDGLFVEIGAIPEVELATKLGVVLDTHGYLKVDNNMETNLPGIYGAGDTTNFFGHFKQDITAAAMGAVAATSAFTHLHHSKTIQEAKGAASAES